MPFFDYLDDEDKLKKKVEPYRIEGAPTSPATVRAPQGSPDFGGVQTSQKPFAFEDQRVALPPDTTGPKPFKGMISEEHSAFLQQQNAKANELKAKAAALVRKHTPPSPSPGGQNTQSIIAKIESADINTVRKLADLVKQATTQQGMSLDGTPEFENFKRENTEFNRMMFKSTMPSAPPPAVDPGKLDAAKKGLETALENMAVASTDEDRKMWSQQAEDLRVTIKEYEKRVKETTPESPPPKTLEEKQAEEKGLQRDQQLIDRQNALTGADGTPGRDSIFEPFSALAPNGRAEFAQQSRKALEKISRAIPFNNPMQRVAFYVALPAYAKALGDDAYNRVIRPFAGLDKEQESFDKQVRGEQVKQEEAGAATANERKAKAEEAKRIMGEIGNLSIMNTPLGVVGFILTSLVLGPRMASFLFSRSAARGKLEGELKLIVGDMKDLREKEQMHFRMGQEASGRALDSAFRFGLGRAEAGERRESALQSRSLDHYYRMKEIEAQNGGRQKDDPGWKELDGAYRRQVSLATRAEAKIASSERKIEKLQERLADPLTAKDAKAMLQKALTEESSILDRAEAERAQAEGKMNAIDQYMRRYGVTAGAVGGSEGGGSGAAEE